MFTSYSRVCYIVSFLNISSESFQQTYSIGQSRNKHSIAVLSEHNAAEITCKNE